MIMPYLSFDGTCEEAFCWYAEVFGGKIMHLSRYVDTGKIMHAQVMLTENGYISGSDAMVPITAGDSICLQVHFEQEETAQQVFAALASDGQVIAALAVNPPPDDNGVSGMLKDRFGIRWIVSAMRNE